ncbi:LytR family transcriptional regulator [Exiguobacterium sp. SH0S1]|uniref:LCP family glycopolymer transferase n=1 Tax=Exiguobacterium sp. SH0S1 TaxID=2510949 RepID=UPI00103DE416|nr:LCP family protein [Exiguobacterium sp. SH0S1]TCI77917.1 LytR family transcriptional regulator [Exiguobacterium sp. SH0S1]
MAKHRKKSPWKKLLAIILGVVTVALIVGGVIVWSMYRDVNETVTRVNDNLQISEKRKQVETIEEKRSVSVLLLGIDRRRSEQGRSDSMIVMTLNPETNEGAMLSIPRDTLTEIVGRGVRDKINHAYAFGGAEMAMDSVEALLDIPIDYVVETDMDAFTEIVDTLGGITVTNNFAFSTDGYRFPVGEVELDGESALSYTRMRYEDPNGDFGRQERQRAVVTAIVEKGRSDFSVDTVTRLLDVAGNHAKTNIEFNELVTLSTDYMNSFRNASTLRIEGTGGVESDGIYYWNPDSASLADVQNELKRLME